MTIYTPDTDGLHCKACDKELGDSSSDRELCADCLAVVLHLNHHLYFEDEMDLENEPK